MLRCVVASLLGTATGRPLLSSAFSSGMVLQRAPASPNLFGWATAEETVSVSFDSVQMTTRVDVDGYWQISLPPTDASTNHTIKVVVSEESATLDDVAFGEVWGCSGQSNMAYNVWMMGTGSEWLGHPAWDQAAIIEDSKNYPNIRLLGVHRSGQKLPQEEIVIAQPWARASPDSIGQATKWGNFSAVCYLTGRNLFNKLGGKVPIGLISSNVGGTQIQRWVPSSTESACDPQVHGSDLYNAMIAPLTKLSMQGWIWYQGEQNIGGGADGGFPATGFKFYSCQFRNLINSWRTDFGNPQMPFFFVQLAAFQDGYHYNITNRSLAELRSAQASVLDLPATGMVTAFDLGMGGGVHPGTKVEVGSRMASAIHANVYGGAEVSEGPVPLKASFSGNSVTITFDMRGSQGWNIQVGQNCSYSRHGGTPKVLPSYLCKGYEVLGQDGKWMDANFSHVDQSGNIAVNSPVEDPAKISYGWSDYPIVDLYNIEGLPVPPFQLDIALADDISV